MEPHTARAATLPEDADPRPSPVRRLTWPTTWPTTWLAPLLSAAVIVVVVVVAVVTTLVVTGQRSDPDNLVVNGGFESGLTGWGTTGAGQRLQLTEPGRTGARAAALSSVGAARVVLEHDVDAVAAVGSDDTFRAGAWVRADTPGVRASMTVDETTRPNRYSSTVSLAAGRWTRVRVVTPVVAPGTGLTVQLAVSGLTPTTGVAVDDVALVQLSGAEEAAVRSVGSPPAARTQPPTTVRPATLFGTSLSTNGRTISEAVGGQEAKLGRLPVVRVFDTGPPPRDSWTRRDVALSGKTIVVSFRASPAVVLSGRLDGDLLHFFRTAPRARDVYWSLNHEPEAQVLAGEYTTAEYRRAWRRIGALARSVQNPRLHATLILSAFTADPVTGRDWRAYFAGRSTIDVLAWDVYNSAVGRPTTYEDPASLFAPLARIAERAGLPFAIGEMGTARTPGDARGVGRAAWLRASGEYLRDRGALFVTYFDSRRNGAFVLDDQPSVAAWRELMTVP